LGVGRERERRALESGRKNISENDSSPSLCWGFIFLHKTKTSIWGRETQKK